MISALNFKPFDRGSIKGFFNLRYHGLTIKGCKLLAGNDGLWFSFPQVKSEQNGEVKYFDQMFISSQEREHVRKLILLDLEQQGHIDQSKPKPKPKSKPVRNHVAHGEDLSEHYPDPDIKDDIPF